MKGKKKMEEAKNFTWFQSYTNALEVIPDRVARAMLALAIIEYGSLGIEPEPRIPRDDDCKFDDTKKTEGRMLEAMFELARPNIDKSREKYINGKKGAPHGIKGGRPRDGESPEDAYIRRNGHPKGSNEIPEPAYLPVDCYDPDDSI